MLTHLYQHGPYLANSMQIMTECWSIIVHGGARTIAAAQQDANRFGCQNAAKVGADILRGGGSALEACERVVQVLEDDQTFNAGSGSVPTSAGIVEMDAAIMDGQTLDVGAVASIRSVRNPVSVARWLLRSKPVLLVGEGASDFAAANGFLRYDVPAATRSSLQHDTVGCVARDTHGRIAVATSTGGLSDQAPGRVGDAPIPGAGFYADDRAGGVAISGDGESILRISLAAQVMALLGHQPANQAVAKALTNLDRVGGEAGIIALSADGRFGIAHNSDHFAVALDASWLPGSRCGLSQADFEGIDFVE